MVDTNNLLTINVISKILMKKCVCYLLFDNVGYLFDCNKETIKEHEFVVLRKTRFSRESCILRSRIKEDPG